MARAGDGRVPYESDGATEKLPKRPFQPEINEESQNISQETDRIKSTGAFEVCTNQVGNSASISVNVGKSELEQMLKEMTFTRSEAQRLISLVHSRIMEESPSPILRLEASSARCSLKRHRHGDETDNFHASIVSSRVLEEQITSPNHLPETPIASLANLPHEVLLNIFMRLLVKQLAQMRSVSKSWNDLLSQSSFIKSHLNRSIHSSDQILLFFHGSCDSKPFTAKPSGSPHLELTNFIKLPFNPEPEDTDGIEVIGSVNGLICSSYDDSVIHIWNPSLSAVLTLPPYSTPSPDYDSINVYFRFGFDPNTDDYKVVKLTRAFKRWLHVEIYSMRKGTWQLITERLPSHITHIIHQDYVCVDGHNGRLHWLGVIGEKMDSKTILAFDLGTETFLEIPLPNATLNDKRVNILGILAGKLCVMSEARVNSTCEVWVIEKYGVAESWVKHYVFSQFTCDLRRVLYGFTSRNEFLINDKVYLVIYDPMANKQKVFDDCYPEEYGADKIVEYVDSLVWVAPAKHDMLDGRGQN